MKRRKIVILDDEESILKTMEYQLSRKGHTVTTFQHPSKALEFIKKEEDLDLVITDLILPEKDGLQVLKEVKQINPFIEVIMITGQGTIESAVEAMKQGAYDYITKPFGEGEIPLIVEKVFQMKNLVEENLQLKQELWEKFDFKNIVGMSKKMQEVFQLIAKVSQTDSNVLILGESGTGKELVARAIHYHSLRKDGPFVAVECAAIPSNLLESELFGYEKGAFTGAFKDKEGKFELADGGTLFLDEIGEMPPEMQAKLLRALQEKEITRLGGKKTVPLNIRIIAATNRDLEQKVKSKEFREDLYYRLNVVSIKLPALRERKEDLPLLIKHFLQKFNRPQTQIEPEAYKLLTDYSWPGNVRELENTIESALVLKNDNIITKEELPETLSRQEKMLGKVIVNLPQDKISLEEIEKDLILAALEKHDWNQTRAAAYLGITRPTLLYRMEKYGIKSQS